MEEHGGRAVGALASDGISIGCNMAGVSGDWRAWVWTSTLLVWEPKDVDADLPEVLSSRLENSRHVVVLKSSGCSSRYFRRPNAGLRMMCLLTFPTYLSLTFQNRPSVFPGWRS